MLIVKQSSSNRFVAHGVLIFALAVINLGCGSNGPFKYVRVSGRVTYDDGSPIPGGCRLIFRTQDVSPIGNAYPRPGMAYVDGNGNFDCATSYKYGDGLVPGKHRVAIQSTDDLHGKPLVADAYTTTETSPLIIDTKDTPFDIKIPKPKPGK